MKILMLAAENGALPGGKVGGIGDVIRDVPLALARSKHQVTVVTPGYQSLSRLPGASLLNTLTIEFSSGLEKVSLYEVKLPGQNKNIRHLLIEHPLFAACGAGQIYCNDVWEPFATDANKFALFCQSLCYALVSQAIATPDILHLHDWHAALVLVLRQKNPAYRELLKIHTVYTIHNLSIQGVRPLKDNVSSLQHWFPALDWSGLEITDPRVPECLNLMRTGINLADKVHVVSPTYAQEITKASNPATGFVGGEGLEKDLVKATKAKKLVGILNGCEYKAGKGGPGIVDKASFIRYARAALHHWVGNHPLIPGAHFHSLERLAEWSLARKKPELIVASIGRLTSQKASLLVQEIASDYSTLESLLDAMPQGKLILLGNGDGEYENFMMQMMCKKKNFLFLCGYSDPLAQNLYQFCDLFLMPSSFEPCGISQMLAMREGKPCLVHSVGGLQDTVFEGSNGFTFNGTTPQKQSQALLEKFTEVMRLHKEQPTQWQTICKNAAASRFLWDDSIKAYQDKLYNISNYSSH